MYITPERITYTDGHSFCPGCGHGIAIRLIGEVLQELDLEEKAISCLDVACGGLPIDIWRYDSIEAAHGRPVPTAVGVKRTRPNNAVFAYLGDGAAYSIGLAETMHAALRDDNIIEIVVNNCVYGMTGGQTSPTSLQGQRTSSSINGKDHFHGGGTFDVMHALSGMDIAYAARGALCGVSNIRNTRKYIKKAFEKQMNGTGFCLIELLSPCPTNWGKEPAEASQYLQNTVMKQFKVGEFYRKVRIMLKEIICSGFGGQGVLTTGMIIITASHRNNHKVTWYPSYGSEMRGGTANCNVKISDEDIGNPYCDNIDILIAMNEPSINKFESRIKFNGSLYINTDMVDDNKKFRDDISIYKIPANSIALQQTGKIKNANIVMLGYMVKTNSLWEHDDFCEAMCAYFDNKGKGSFNKSNLAVFNAGYDFA